MSDPMSATTLEQMRADGRWAAVETYLCWLREHAPEALLRVRDARHWTRKQMVGYRALREGGNRCLVGHAEGGGLWLPDEAGRELTIPNAAARACPSYIRQRAVNAFDGLSLTYSLAHVVPAIQQYAADLLAAVEGATP